MNKTCLIYQPAGIGDILFCQAIVKHYIKLGYHVVYPVKSNLIYLKDYLVCDGLSIVDENSDFPYKERYNQGHNSVLNGDFVFINLDQSQNVVGWSDGFMLSKYKLVGLDYNMWSDGLEIKRNTDRENKLYYDYLKLNDNDDYYLLNTKHGTPPNYAELQIPKLDTKYKPVNMEFIEGTNIMDWIKVIENSKGIVTVDTCIQYIMEKLDIDYDFYYCYPRDGGKGGHIKNIIKLFNKIRWEYKKL